MTSSKWAPADRGSAAYEDALRRCLAVYAVTDPRWLGGRRLCDVVEQAILGGATFVQLREKDVSHARRCELAREVLAVCRAHNVPFVVNDDVECALEVGADGVHVGQSDIKGRDIRAMIGPDKILGISAGTVEEAQAAEKAGADYIGVGAVFGTSTKKNARNLSKEKLKEISSSVSIPVVAIGGINASNVEELSGCGVDGVAVVSAIFAAEDPGAATEHLKTLAAEMVSHE